MECFDNREAGVCACTYPSCPRKGRCCECLRYHRAQRQLPACYFDKAAEQAYDRSIEHFVQLVGEGRI